MSIRSNEAGFLDLPKSYPEVPRYIPESEDLKLTEDQVNVAAEILLRHVKSAFRLNQASHFEITYNLGGIVEIKYDDGTRGYQHLSVTRGGRNHFTFSVSGPGLPSDTDTKPINHINFQDAYGSVRDSRNTLHAIDRALLFSLPFQGEPAGGKRYAEVLKEEFVRRSYMSDQPSESSEA